MTRTFSPYPFRPAVHPAVVPPLSGGTDTVRHVVAIVGAGSRAICISRRSLEIAKRLGALDGFLQIGLPWTGGRSFYRDVEVLNFSMPTDENQALPPMVYLAQYHIEEILLLE